MAAPNITFIGNLASDPELKFTPSGQPVLNGRALNTPRHKDRNSGEWVDDETIAYDWSLWGNKAEAAAEVLRKGDKVIIVGRLRASSWETKEGEKRTRTTITADEIGQAVKSRGSANGYAPKAFESPKGGSDDDPWATNGSNDECPF